MLFACLLFACVAVVFCCVVVLVVVVWFWYLKFDRDRLIEIACTTAGIVCRDSLYSDRDSLQRYTRVRSCYSLVSPDGVGMCKDTIILG